MISFDVLDRQRSIHGNAFLEASAGTGKTFAIENIVVRLLIENDPEHVPLMLERILVVTFTRASTRDLKARVRANLETILGHLENSLSGVVAVGVLADYILEILEKGDEAVRFAKRRIEQALLAFDRAQIFTIHGFCWRMLKSFAVEAGVSLAAVSAEQDEYPKTRLLQVVRDFVRTELTDKAYSTGQLSIALKSKRGIEQLQNEILKLVSKGVEIAPLEDVSQLFKRFQVVMEDIKQEFGLEGDKIISDFLVHAPAYNKLVSKKVIKPKAMKSVQKFAALFDKEALHRDDFDGLIDEGLYIVDALSPENKQKKDINIALEKLHYPNLLTVLREKLMPIVRLARDGEAIIARMAGDCQKLMWHYQQQEEMIGHNDLLQQMLAAIKCHKFAGKVRNSYDAVIIDEFQDTDPVQWEIFRTLFEKENQLWKGFLYLVGDPKQSIYAFRQADIYTYLSAANTLGKETWATLNTNFRSRPQLVQALNTLFLSADNLFPLPRQHSSLKYRPVKAGRKEHAGVIGASVQFWLPQVQSDNQKNITLNNLETLYFFPAIVNEISRLKREAGICLRQCAVLVADRYQADRLMKYFKQSGMPTLSQRGESLKNSMAVHAMRDVLKGILNYQHSSSLKLALASKVIGLGHTEIPAFDLSDRHGAVVGLCDQLRHVLVHEGAALFFPMFLQSVWHADCTTVFERILSQHDGIGFYREWQDIADLLIEEQAAESLSADELLGFLDRLDELAVDDEERLKATVDNEQEGVSILTSHVSKGLEFDVVFALGLIKRPKAPHRLIPVEMGQRRYLALADSAEDERYKKHCEELDAEKMRQLYVALTRARLCVYLPVDAQPKQKSLDLGEASPMDLLIARLGKKSQCSDNFYEDLYSRISMEDGSSLKTFVKDCAADIAFRVLCPETSVPVFSAPFQGQALFPPQPVAVPGEPLFVQSFTSLSQGGAATQEVSGVDAAAPHNFICEVVRSPHHLPAGSDTGTLLHTILECVPFAQSKLWQISADVKAWVRPFLKGTLFVEWEDTIASMVFDAFKTPLPGVYGGFCLAEVDPKKVYRETEFFFASRPMAEDQRLLFDDGGVQPGFLKGVIDLFFEHQGKYYLLDWKSNWLGTTLGSYEEPGLSAAMLQHNYHLQAGIYAEAMRRYLRLFDKRPFEVIFGGAFYLFLRGLSPNSGIYHTYPNRGR